MFSTWICITQFQSCAYEVTIMTEHFLERYTGLKTGTSLHLLTCITAPERGSMIRSFLSLQLVASRLPSVLKDMLRMTSEWQSIIFTGSPISRFQIRICHSRKTDKMETAAFKVIETLLIKKKKKNLEELLKKKLTRRLFFLQQCKKCIISIQPFQSFDITFIQFSSFSFNEHIFAKSFTHIRLHMFLIVNSYYSLCYHLFYY